MTPQFINKIKVRLAPYQQSQPFYFIAATVIGLITGACAHLLKWMIGHVGRLLTAHFTPDGFNWWLLVIPVVGVLLTGAYQKFVLKANISHGVEQLVDSIKRKDYFLKPYLTYAPMIASTFTLGFGGSAGSEGPIAYTGAAIGSNLGRKFGFSPQVVMIMVGCGAGAGIAGIFKAPVGGMLFTLEVLKMELTTMSVMALVLACVISYATAYALSGFSVDLSYLQIDRFDPSLLIYVVALGAFCGFYSLYYNAVMQLMRRFYDRINLWWLKNLAGGVLLALILFMFPAMYGEGYPMMGHVINGDSMAMMGYTGLFHGHAALWVPLVMSGLIVVLKPFACSASNSAGDVAGDFAPTLFAGCFLGFFFASALNYSFGLSLPVAPLAFLGMCGVMSGAISAPFMALFITAEMTNGYALMLPLLITASMSYGIVRIFKAPAYYNNPYSNQQSQ